MDKLVDKIAALGVPGLVLLVAMAVTGWAGAAAITTALAVLGGPFGMLGGIAVLGLLALMSQGLAEYGFEAIFKSTVDQLRTKGKSKSDIEREIESYFKRFEIEDKGLFKKTCIAEKRFHILLIDISHNKIDYEH